MTTSDPTPFNKRLGAAVRARRVAAGLSQQAVGDKLGVTFQQQQKYERGINRISVETLVKIASELGTTCQQLINEACADDAPAPEKPATDMSERMRLETVRILARLSPAMRGAIRNLAKALAGEEGV
ncbi:MAG TPA: helix-turn-helix transcriptional regulator [Bryobacteraceae bacterium]|jgi:transcriptional regulator with XRE-family HTH domain|nr:helix-turn-helix transcriptional regulator [Bryobacteraceae bacterium]